MMSLKARIEQQLEHSLPSVTDTPATLHQAMRYSVLTGGKRIRALLVYTTGETFGASLAALDVPAVCVELVHSYSLVHDDLPAMDDDDLRRGKASCHKAFGEATAILAGDALQSLAFELLVRKTPYYSESTQLEMIRLLSQAIGSRGMAGGQMLDIEGESGLLSKKEVDIIHQLKTGALIRASVLIGARVANVTKHELSCLEKFAEIMGIAFQIRDDILDKEKTTQELGKTAGKDQSQNKATATNGGFIHAKTRTQKLFEKAESYYLSQLSQNTDKLKQLAHYMINREY